MTLTLYKNTSDKRVLNKTITLVVTYNNVLFLDDTSIINPRFDLALDLNIIPEINYCYCSDTKRYYYINNITPTAGGRVYLDCSVDVLMTYKDKILEIPALIYTQTQHANVLLANNNLPQQANDQIQNIKFTESELTTSGLSDCFVMISYKGGVQNV